MGQRENRSGGRHSQPPPRHRAPARGKAAHASREEPRGRSGRESAEKRPRREALQDNYYYELPREFEDISSYSSEQRRRADREDIRRKPARERKAPSRRRMGLGKKIGLVFLLLAVVIAGLFVYMFMGLKVSSLDGDLAVNPSARTAGVKNIALFGVDSRDGENIGRSDAVMVLTIDSRSHTLKMASFMRDAEVYIEDYGYDKLTHAYAYGGPELAVRTLNQNFQLDIEDYVTVNFFNMAGIVDAFGGVEMELTGEEMREVNANLWNLSQEAEREGAKAPIKMSDYFTATDGTHNMIDGEYTGGKVMLTGAQAVAYSRIRYLGNDDARTGRQHKVLMGLVDRAKSRTVFSYPVIAHGVMPNCETSLGLVDMASLVPFALGDIQMESITLPGEAEGAYDAENEDGLAVIRFDTELVVENLHRFIYGE